MASTKREFVEVEKVKEEVLIQLEEVQNKQAKVEEVFQQSSDDSKNEKEGKNVNYSIKIIKKKLTFPNRIKSNFRKY